MNSELSPFHKAELLCYGEQGTMSFIHFPPRGEDRPDDMATAWLEGDTAKYEALLLKRKARVAPKPGRARPKPVGRPRRIDRARVLELRASGRSCVDIARTIGCSWSQVARICRNKSITPNTTQAIPRA